MGNCNEPVAEACLDCELPQLDRNHYFTGKLMVERDFTDEQRYYMGKLRRHNLRLHGHGVVCGLKVKRHPNPSCRNQYVIVEPGTAIDCCGREILVQREEYVDFRALVRAAWKKDHGVDSEPDRKTRMFQLCVRYRECPTEPTPALFNDCGCDDTACQPNRIHESYAFDVILEPKPAHDDPAAVKLEWRSTIALAHATHVVAAEDTIFVAAQSNPDTLYAVDASNLSVQTSRAFTGRTIESLTLSGDGKWLFVAAAGGTDPEVHVLSAADINKPAANALTIAGADAKQLKLAAAADGRLYALDIKQKQLLVWGTDVTTANPPAAPKKVIVASGASALGIAPDGRYVFVAIADSAKVSAVDTATMAVAQDLSVGTGGTARPRAIAVIEVADGDNIVAVDPDNKQAYLLGWRPNGATPDDRALSLADPLGGYSFPPASIIAGSAGNWVYVVERDTASKKNYLQPLNLHEWLLKQPSALKPAFAVGTGDVDGVLTDDARRLFVAYHGEDTDAGGVAVIDVTGGDCDGIFARCLDGCPVCDDECLVLATISDYAYDSAIDDAQIDNLRDRKLLPSTDAIVEVIKCILANCCHGGGGTGPAGPPGPPGAGVKSADAETVAPGTPASAMFDPVTGNVHFRIPKGDNGDAGTPGAGVKSADAETVPYGTPASAQFNTATGNVHFKIPEGKPGQNGQNGTALFLELPHIVGINWSHDGIIKVTEAREMFKNGLVVAFDREMWAETLDAQTVQLQFASTTSDDRLPFDTMCFCNVVCQVEGINFRDTPVCDRAELPEIDPHPVNGGPVLGVRLMPTRNREPTGRWLPGVYRVVLEGDQILGFKKTKVPSRVKPEEMLEVYPALDGNHLGPGLLGPRSRLMNHPELGKRRCPTGDLAEGGRFLSWFRLE